MSPCDPFPHACGDRGAGICRTGLGAVRLGGGFHGQTGRERAALRSADPTRSCTGMPEGLPDAEMLMLRRR
ncbi:hypothetical protein ACKKBF_B39675 [Auxenochlorella protothecoides x Auxenochlorella symbiontica]